MWRDSMEMNAPKRISAVRELIILLETAENSV